MAPQTRRSGRARKPTKYSNDAFEGLDIVDSGSISPIREPHLLDDTDEDGEFVEEQSREILEQSHNREESSESEVESTSEDDVATEIVTSPKRTSRCKTRGAQNPQESFHSRGLPPPQKFSQKQAIRVTAGNDEYDVSLLTKSKLKWAEDATLPHKQPDETGCGGMSHPYGYTEEKRLSESTNDWKWYNDGGGRETMALAQDASFLGLDAATSYYCQSPKSHKVLLGSFKDQKAYNIELWESISLKHAWKSNARSIEGGHYRNTAAQERNGWLFNSGGRVLSLDWAPNQEGDIQYLAVVVSKKAPVDHLKHSAFVPTRPYGASIQIWAFTSSRGGEYDTIDMTQAPRLAQVICTEWGSVRRVQWCPAARSFATPDQNLESIGLLAGIWSDGYVRALDVRINGDSHDPAKVHVKYQGAAFASKPPDSICTCVAWITSHSLAVGCANGFVAIWNVATSILETKDSLTQQTDVSSNESQPLSEPRTSSSPELQRPVTSWSGAPPYFYHPLHDTFVLSMSSTYPLYSHFLLTTSMDGNTRLTDIRSPHVDYVTSARTRVASMAIAYCPQVQSAIAPEDNNIVRALPLRRFFQSTHVARAGSPVLSLSAGKMHATLLIGSADGSALVTNPMRKMLGRRSQGKWQQAWFRHEWVPSKESPPSERPLGSASEEVATNGDTTASAPEQDLEIREGVSRITESYKLESEQLAKSDKGGEKGIVYSTIFEDEAAVTCVVWNPNLRCGGWAAAGMGSGLVRVEDLAI